MREGQEYIEGDEQQLCEMIHKPCTDRVATLGTSPNPDKKKCQGYSQISILGLALSLRLKISTRLARAK